MRLIIMAAMATMRAMKRIFARVALVRMGIELLIKTW